MSDYVREHLVAPTTFLAYSEKWLGPAVQWSEPLKRGYTHRERELLEKLAPGDELWEWHDAGEIPLSMRSGLAILRDGRIIEHWTVGMS